MTPDPLPGRLAAALDGGPPVIIGPRPEPAPPPGTALVLRTSGSTTGVGRPVAISAAALHASARACHEFLGGPGRWVLMLPTDHIAGIQVLVRSILAGTEALRTPAGGFTAAALTAALEPISDDGGALYASMVPTQLHRVLRDVTATRAARRIDAILLGGSAPPPALLTRAHEAGLTVVVTYGMTETSGGCVYDGRPLRGVGIHLDRAPGDHLGRIRLSGPTLASAYLDDGPPLRAPDRPDWFPTSDVGAITDGRLRVEGRVDDVILSGGLNIHPAPIERALSDQLDGGLIVGTPDPEWGHVVTAVVARDRAPGLTLRTLRDAVGEPSRRPRALVRLDRIPELGPGKPDRRAAAQAAASALRHGEGERA